MRAITELSSSVRLLAGALALPLVLTACDSGGTSTAAPEQNGSELTATERGRILFRHGTFGNEGYWTDAVRLPQGLMNSNLTVLDALRAGLQIDSNRVEASLAATLASELDTDLSSSSAPNLNDALIAKELLESGAVLGLVPVDVDEDGSLLFGTADALGVSCALCHSVTDGSLYDGRGTVLPGSIGRRVDGRAPEALDLGGLFAAAGNSRALYPLIQLTLGSLGSDPIGRTANGISVLSNEADVDALLRDPAAYPTSQADLYPDGIGAPTVIPSLYDVQLAAPYGVDGAFAGLEDMINWHVTVALDPTSLLTGDGDQFLSRLAPTAGREILNGFADVLAATGVSPPAGGFPWIDANATGTFGSAASPVGLRIDDAALSDLVAYLSILRRRTPVITDASAVARGEQTYDMDCAQCHGARGRAPVDALISLDEMLASYDPTWLLYRGFPYSIVYDDHRITYDDRLVFFDTIFDPSQAPTLPRRIALPPLPGAEQRPRLLHDGSVHDLDDLLDASRGALAPHPFYVDPADVDDLKAFLRSL